VRLVSWNVNGRYGPVLAKQISAVAAREPDIVALQEVRARSWPAWWSGLAAAGLDYLVDSSSLLSHPAPEGAEYKRRYFNVIAARVPLVPLPTLDIAYPERYLAATAGSDLELHNAHLPPGSTRGLVKVQMFQALHARLANTSARRRILCGDFNAPREEHLDGTVKFWGGSHPRHRDEWNEAERSVILGSEDHGLVDVFRALHRYDSSDGFSWVARRGAARTERRYDHVFASARPQPRRCSYLHDLRERGLSDHSPIEAEFAD
jgi:exonuclease III